jgi:ubiquinone/menaquinone biosynthesis C-methylase UbiE
MKLERIIWQIYERVYDAILLQLIPYRSMMSRAIGALNPQNDGSYFDAGCGTGNLLLQLFESNRKIKITGADFSPAMLARARKKLHAKGCQADLLELDLNEKLPFDNGVFDGITCVNVLYAIKKPLNLLQELNRVLKAEGRLVLITPFGNPKILPVVKEHLSTLKQEHPKSWLLHYSVFIGSIIIPATIGLMVNLFIKNNAKYHFFYEDGLKTLLNAGGFDLKLMSFVYSDQNWFLVLEKLQIQAS